MQEVFIGQRKATVQMSKGKCTGIKFLIPEEEKDKILYIRKTKDDIEILNNMEENCYERRVGGTYNPLMNRFQTYLNFRGFVNETTLFDIYKTQNGYHLKKSAEPITSTRERNFGNRLKIYSNSTIRIPINYFKELCGERDITKCKFLVEETLTPTQSVRITIVDKKDVKDTYVETNVMRRTIEQDKYSRYLAVAPYIRLSRFFYTAANLQKTDVLYCRWNGRNSVVIEKIEKCDICGHPVNQGCESIYKLETCSSCNSALKILKKYSEKEDNLTKIRQALEATKKQIDSLKKEEK